MLTKANKKIVLAIVGVLILVGLIVLAWLGKDILKANFNLVNTAKTATPSPKPVATVTPTPATRITPPSPPPTPFAATPPEISWGNRNKQQVIFTFDAGAGTQSFQAILATLEKYHVKGTFFLTGSWANKNPDLTKQISKKGYEIYNHTFDHPYLTQVADSQIISELKGADDAAFNLTGNHTGPYFRPPYGARNNHVRDVAATAGYQSVVWSVDALDWKESSGETAEQVKTIILQGLKPGTIYLMHIGDNITGQILDTVFQQIKAQGYSIVSLTQGIQ